ncbi:UNVERIFIED_CONTAM: hypothetical protein Slati_2176100, partial [Sesamum latifolium]
MILFSNTYNPGWRDHPNLRYGNQPQNFQRGPYQPPPPPPQSNSNTSMPLEDIVKTLALSTQQFQQETHSSIQNLESQISQLASRQSFGIPSTRRGHALQNRTENSVVRGHAEQGKIGEELENSPKQAEKSNQVGEEHPKVFVPKPPFPERFFKSKKEEEEKDILETLRKVEVNIPLLNAIKQVPRYAEFLKEMCTNKFKLRGNEWVSMGENTSSFFKENYLQNAKIR